jgi:predicted dehydrogenase
MNLYVDEHAYGDPSYYAVQHRKCCQVEPHERIEFKGTGDICGNLKSFFKAVREGGEPYPSLRDGARAVAVVFAAEEAAKSGQTVAVPAM